jgi:hypothetical protein
MKSRRTVKTKIKQLVRELGGYETVAVKLEVALSYVYRLGKGTVPGKRLYRDICKLYKESKGL